jgi:hypothetical protein
MKLYAFQPQAPGQLSYFVAATSEEEAIAAVRERIDQGVSNRTLSLHEVQGFGTPLYELTVLDAGQVVVNDNF